MSEHLKGRFGEAIMADLAVSNEEEPIMVNLFAFEHMAQEIKEAIDSIILDEIMIEGMAVFDNEADIIKWM